MRVCVCACVWVCFSSIKVIECYSEIEKHKDSCLQQMRFCLYKARLVAILVNLHFVSFESQPCQSTVSKNSDQQTRGLPASGEQRCVSDHGQLVCVDCFFLTVMTSGFILGRSCCMCVTDSSCTAGETAWEDAVCETLEKEVEDTRKMVSALQVHSVNWHSVKSD